MGAMVSGLRSHFEIELEQYFEEKRALEFLGFKATKEFRQTIFRRHIWLADELLARYRKIAKSAGYPAANGMLLDFEKRMKIAGTGIFADASDEDICSYAEVKSKNMEKDVHDFAKRCGIEQAIEYAQMRCEQAGVQMELEIKKTDTPDQITEKRVAALARICDALWWRRKLRCMAGRIVERLLREWGLVGRYAGMYCSDHILNRRREQKSRTADLLSDMEAENQFGYTASLAELAGASVSNPENRRCELMVRIRGYEEIAQSLEHDAVFYTLTAPSKYHAIGHSGKKNEKFAGYDPRQGSDYLNGVWQRVRAEWHRYGIKAYGFRIAEPHHDGTPHWHLLLFMEAEVSKQATAIFRKHALIEDGAEEGAEKYRFQSVKIDWSRGSAAGYIAKYVAKNIAGHEHDMAGDIDIEGGGSLKDNAERVEAWASTWGIRQFQQIGSASVTVWRELRRRMNENESIALQVGELAAVRAACLRSDWREFVMLVGGPLAPRKDLLVRALNVLSDHENKYGEWFSTVRGVIMKNGLRVETKIYEWKIKRRNSKRR